MKNFKIGDKVFFHIRPDRQLLGKIIKIDGAYIYVQIKKVFVYEMYANELTLASDAEVTIYLLKQNN